MSRHQFAMVMDLNKCLGCQTCTMACKTMWTDGRIDLDYPVNQNGTPKLDPMVGADGLLACKVHAFGQARFGGRGLQLLLQGAPDMPIARTAASILYRHLLEAGVRVFGTDGKEAVWDGRLTVTGGRVLDLRTPGGRLEEVFVPLHGAHQGDNAACAASFSQPLRRASTPKRDTPYNGTS